MNRFETLIRDRRLQIGAVAGVAAIALCGFALAGADRPDAKAPDRWTVYLSVPLAKLLPGGAQPGDKLYLNIFRATKMQDTLGWIPTFGGFHEPERLGEVTLAK